MPTFIEAAQKLRDHIWEIIEAWFQTIINIYSQGYQGIPESQVINGLPSILRGVTKVIENEAYLRDFEPLGLIYQTAAEFGESRYHLEVEVEQLLFEYEVLRRKTWHFCRQNIEVDDVYELERRVNLTFDKAIAASVKAYLKIYVAELKDLARRDRLTGLYNYATFYEQLDEEVKRARRFRRSLSIMMIDIDGFKDYNDQFGHKAGDIALYEIAKIFTRSIRHIDFLARYGGDEFMIILPETSKKSARRVAERIRRAIKAETTHAARVRGDIKVPLTISIGIACYPKDGQTADDLVVAADDALYKAKEQGRDVIVQK